MSCRNFCQHAKRQKLAGRWRTWCAVGRTFVRDPLTCPDWDDVDEGQEYEGQGRVRDPDRDRRFHTCDERCDAVQPLYETGVSLMEISRSCHVSRHSIVEWALRHRWTRNKPKRANVMFTSSYWARRKHWSKKRASASEA